MLKALLITLLLAFSSSTVKKPMELKEQVQILMAKVPELEKEIKKNNEAKKTTEVVERITSKGYKKFIQSSEFQRLDELMGEYYEEFLIDFLESHGIAGKLFKEFKAALMTVLESDGEWKVFKFIFSDKKFKSDGGKLGYMLILVQLLKTNEINFISIKTASEFEMFPDIVIIKKTTTVDGEVVKEETIVKEEEKKMKEEDLKNLLNYFELVALKKLAQNIPLDKPFWSKRITPSLYKPKLRNLAEIGFAEIIGKSF